MVRGEMKTVMETRQEGGLPMRAVIDNRGVDTKAATVLGEAPQEAAEIDRAAPAMNSERGALIMSSQGSSKRLRTS